MLFKLICAQLAVWLLRNPALYYPLDQEQPRCSTRANPVVQVCLWKTFFAIAPDSLITEQHPSLKDVVVVKLKVRCFQVPCNILLANENKVPCFAAVQ